MENFCPQGDCGKDMENFYVLDGLLDPGLQASELDDANSNSSA